MKGLNLTCGTDNAPYFTMAADDYLETEDYPLDDSDNIWRPV